MVTKFICYCLARNAQGDWNNAATAAAICGGLVLSILLIPIIIVLACIRAMFIKH